MPRFESPTQIDHVVRSIMVVDGFRPRSVRYEADDVMVDKERFHVYQNFECSMQRSCPCPPTYRVAVNLANLSHASWQSVAHDSSPLEGVQCNAPCFCRSANLQPPKLRQSCCRLMVNNID
jgi:hypothetical protein